MMFSVVWCAVCGGVEWSGVVCSGVEWSGVNGIRMSGMGRRMKWNSSGVSGMGVECSVE